LNCSSLKSLTFPTALKAINQEGFITGCYALEEIKMNGEGSTYKVENNCLIQGYTLVRGCKTSIIPNYIKYLDVEAFYGSAITNIVVPEGVEGMNIAALSGCPYLKSISLPSTLTSLGNAFIEPSNSLEDITLHTVNDSVLVEIRDLINTIGEMNLTIAEGVTAIPDRAFQNCTGLASVNIPSSVTSIGLAAFISCSNLKTINIAEGVTTIGVSAFSGTAAIEFVIPDSVTEFNGFSEGCGSVEYLTIGTGLKDLGVNIPFMFNCNIKSVIFRNPNGWTVTDSDTMHEWDTLPLSSSDLADPEIAASYLKSEDYWGYWRCSE